MNTEKGGVMCKQYSPKELWCVCILLPITYVNIVNCIAYRNEVMCKRVEELPGKDVEFAN